MMIIIIIIIKLYTRYKQKRNNKYITLIVQMFKIHWNKSVTQKQVNIR